MTVIVDTGALIALYDRSDRYHSSVIDAFRAFDRHVVPALVLSEADYLLRKYLGRASALALLDGVIGGYYSVEGPTASDFRRARELDVQYADLNLGLTDCTVIAAAERLGVPDVLTVDQRDFRPIQSKLGSLRLLPADA